MGQIAKAGGPRRSYVCGHEIALDGDILQCKCPNPPRMIATTQKRSWVDDSATRRTAVGAPGIAAQTTHDEQFSLTDDDGQPLRGVRYRVRIGTNVVANGVTDAGGRTQRINTEDARRLTLEISGGT